MGDYRVFFDATKTTNGQRFYTFLYRCLAGSSSKYASVVLFNVSASLKDIILAKMRGRKVVLRVAALYFDSYSPEAAHYSTLLQRIFYNSLLYIGVSSTLVSHAYNFFNRNYGVMLRVILADYLVHQSHFSKQVMSNYFKKKRSIVIPNGFPSNLAPRFNRVKTNHFRLLTIYDSKRVSKRIYDVIKFTEFANCNGFNCTLTIMGFDNKLCREYPSDFSKLLKSEFVNLLPKYVDLSEDVAQQYRNHDAFITFAYRDACPNIVVEAMSFGIPIVALDSGGLIDLIQIKDYLIPFKDSKSFHVHHRYLHSFPSINFEKVLTMVKSIDKDPDYYSSQISKIFQDNLEIKVIARRYKEYLESI